MLLSIEERFEKYFVEDSETGCWNWIGAFDDRDLYGKFHVLGKTCRANRVAWELYVGPIPGDLQVLHSCDNTKCVNPGHMFLGSVQDNMADKVHKDRQQKGEDHCLSKLTEEQVKEIRHAALLGSVLYPDLAKRFHVSRQQIGRIVRGQSWQHV
jgi:hypothetical protein